MLDNWLFFFFFWFYCWLKRKRMWEVIRALKLLTERTVCGTNYFFFVCRKFIDRFHFHFIFIDRVSREQVHCQYLQLLTPNFNRLKRIISFTKEKSNCWHVVREWQIVGSCKKIEFQKSIVIRLYPIWRPEKYRI